MLEMPSWENDPGALADAISSSLRTSCYSGLHSILVSVRDGVVRLEGCVASFHLKQVAQEAVLRYLGRAILQNDLEVFERPTTVSTGDRIPDNPTARRPAPRWPADGKLEDGSVVAS